MAAINFDYSNGYVSARGPEDLGPGEMESATGIYYKKGDPHPWKQKGRTAFGTVLSSNRIKGLALCQFDSGTDQLVAYAGTVFRGATPGTTGTFASLATGLNASGTDMTACHMNDRWYIGNGYDRNKKLKPTGVMVDAGMQTPSIALTATAAATSGSVAAPQANSGSFSNPTFAYDSNDDTYASATRTTAGSTTHTWLTWAASSTAGRTLEVKWWLAGLPLVKDTESSTGSSGIGTGGVVSAGFKATVKLEKSEDTGATWTTFLETTYTSVPSAMQTASSPTLTANSSALQFRATLTYVSGTNSATLRINTVQVKVGSTTSNFSTTTGIYYAYTEYDQDEDIESPPSELTPIVTISTQNQVTLTRSTAINSTATHWRLYRIYDGGDATISNLGLIATIPIAQTTYIDTFAIASSVATAPIVPLMTIGDLHIPRDTQAPAFTFMFNYDGSVCGLSRDFPRELRYSDAGRPESYPEFYVVSAFSLPEHDRLVCGVDLGRTCVIFAEGAVVAIDGLPRIVDGKFEAGNARPIAGHPGCVGQKAMTKFSVGGEGRAAWVSPFGVYITNGETCDSIALDIDWETDVPRAYLSTSELAWDAENLILWLSFDSDGDGLNDKNVPIHMSPTHSKNTGQPKWGQPTSKAVSCSAAGLVSDSYRRWTGHTSDGVVYLENSGFLDEATGSAVSATVKTGSIDTGERGIAVYKCDLEHSDWGTGQTATMTVELGRDFANSSQSVVSSIDLTGARATQIMVARAGEWASVQVSHTASGQGRFGKGVLEARAIGKKGVAPRWVSASATP